MEGFRSISGIGGYRTRFSVPAGEGRLKLRFEGVYSGAEVWVNGWRVAYHEGGALPFEVDITELVHQSDNLLAVRVSEHTPVSDRLDKMSEYADFPLAGIIREVVLFRVPSVHMGALAFHTTFDAGFRDARIDGRVGILNESSNALERAFLTARLADVDGKTITLVAQPIPVQVKAWQRTDLDFPGPFLPRKMGSGASPFIHFNA